MTQSPLRPPTMKAALSTPGQTATASALSSRSRGISFSGTDMILRRTSAASFEWREASAARLGAGAERFCAAAAADRQRIADADSRNAVALCKGLINSPLLDLLAYV